MVQQQKTNTTNKQLMSNETDSLNHGTSNSIYKGNSVHKDHPNVINIDKAIIVSDLHLGYVKCNAKAFTDFLSDCISKQYSKEYSLFILGDLWDLWRKDDIIYSRESDEILSLVNQFKDVYYLPGNHDHIKLDAYIITLSLTVTILADTLGSSGEKNFYLVHGHELEVISKLISLKLSEYEKISDQLCRMNDTEGNIASYLHEMFHKIFTQGQPQITDILQTAEQRQGMDAIDKFAKSKARYPLLEVCSIISNSVFEQ